MEEKINDILRWIEYKGHRILFSDYRDLKFEELTNAIQQCEKDFAELGKAGGSEFLLLTDLTGAYLDKEAIEAFVRLGRTVDPFAKASAVAGMSGLRKRMIRMHNRIFSVQRTAFDSLDEAKEWLINVADE